MSADLGTLFFHCHSVHMVFTAGELDTDQVCIPEKHHKKSCLFRNVTNSFLIKYTKYTCLSRFLLLFPIPKSVESRTKFLFSLIFSIIFFVIIFRPTRPQKQNQFESKADRILVSFDRFTTILKHEKNGVR